MLYARGRRTRRTALSLTMLSAIMAAGACTTPGGGGGAAPTPGPAPTPRPGAAAPGGCAPVEVLAARGTSEPQSGSMIMGGLTRGIAQQTGGTTYEVRYSSSAEYMVSPQEGVTDTLNRIKARSAACPNQVYVLNGYSKGAIVMTNVMRQISPDLAPKVKAVVMYGSPMHKANSPSSAGTGKNGNTMMPGTVPAAWTSRTRQYCHAGDPVCGAGANFMAHVGYGQYQADGIAFAVRLVNGS
jgi:hypothetical protein